MAKTDKERQAKKREKLKADKEAYKAYLEEDKLRKAKKQLKEKKNWTDQQNTALKLKACVRYFRQICIFTPNNSPSKTMKNAFYFI